MGKVTLVEIGNIILYEYNLFYANVYEIEKIVI